VGVVEGAECTQRLSEPTVFNLWHQHVMVQHKKAGGMRRVGDASEIFLLVTCVCCLYSSS
jgi:hypothetical protein